MKIPLSHPSTLTRSCVLSLLFVMPVSAQLADYLATKTIAWQVDLPFEIGVPVELGDQVLFTSGGFADRVVHRTDGQTTLEVGGVPQTRKHVRAGNQLFYFDHESLQETTIFATDGNSIAHQAVGPLGYLDFDVIIPGNVHPVADRIVFAANGASGWDLHYFDGDASGSLDAPLRGSFPPILLPFDGEVYFEDRAGSGGFFKTDAISYQPLQVDGRSIDHGRRFFEFNDYLYFSAASELSPQGYEFLRTDGEQITSLGIFRIRDDQLITDDELFLWGHTDPQITRKRLYRSEGMQLEPLGFETLSGSFTRMLGSLRGEVFFRHQTDVMRTDGDGVVDLGDIGYFRGPDANDVIEYQGYLYIPGLDGLTAATGRFGILKTNGDEVEWIQTTFEESQREPRVMGKIGDQLLFLADGPFGVELLRFDGDTMEWIDLNPNGDSFPEFLGEVDGDMFFSADAPGGPTFVTDGTTITGLGNVEVTDYGENFYLTHYVGEGTELYKLTTVPEPCYFPALVLLLALCWRLRSRL